MFVNEYNYVHTYLLDIINIFDENGDQLVADAIINSVGHVGSGSASGFDMSNILHFTCITVSGHENATWMSLFDVGEVNVTYNPGTFHMSVVEVSIEGDSFTVSLSCSSAASQQFSTVTITSGKRNYMYIIALKN